MVILKLKGLADRLNKSITDIARETGINRNTITALFHNKVDGIRFETLAKICTQYGVSVSDLLELKVEPAPEHTRISWYRQEGAIVPFSIWPVCIAITEYKYLLKGSLYSFGEGYCYYQKNYGWLYWDSGAFNTLARAILGEYGANEATAKKYFNQYLRASVDLEQAYRNDDPERVLAMNDREIVEHLFRVNAHYRKFWEHSLFIDSFDPGVDHEIISGAAKTYDLAPEEVAVLTTPEHMTFANERLFELLKIAEDIRRSIKGEVTEAGVRKRIQQRELLIREYMKSFDYYKSNYSAIFHITAEEVYEEIFGYVSRPEKLKDDLTKLARYEENQKAAMAAILKRHHLATNPLFFVNVLTYWREHRKKLNLMGFHILDSVLAAVEQRTGILKTYLRYMTFDEVEGVLKGSIGHAALKQRHDQGVLFHFFENGYKLIQGQEAESIRADLDASSSGTEGPVTELKGQTASQGYAKGVARIVLDHADFEKFKTGEILVTGMTRPEFVPLMEKAAGIVTNEGGITCHAAIVSRELGKPCIIGTKNATAVIKDGDLVEVRANHGTVKILRQ